MISLQNYILNKYSQKDFCTIRFQTLDELKVIILKNPDIFTWKTNKHKSNIYLFCCMYKTVEMLKFLETCEGFNNDILREHNYKNNDCYIQASSTSNIPVLEYLENKHNWNIYTTNKGGFNSLMKAALSNNVLVLKYLYEKHNYDISLKDIFGFTANDYAIEYNRTRAIKFFGDILPSRESLYEENNKLKERLRKIKNLMKIYFEK